MKFVVLAIHQTLCVGFLSLAIASFPIPSKAITVQEVRGPRPNGWVTDTIDILSPATEAEINRSISQLEAQNSCEIMLITVPETSPYSSPREFALAWFKYWTIGKKGLDNGVLLLYSKGDDRIEIVTGWGIVEIFPNDRVVSLIKGEIRPRVNQGNFNGAMLTGTQEIIKVLQTYKPHPSPHTDNLISTKQVYTLSPFNRPTYIWIFAGCGAAVSIFAGLGIARSRRPVFIKLAKEPQPLRIPGLDKHDKEITSSLGLWFFSSTFTIALLVSGGFIASFIAGYISYLISYNQNRNIFDKEIVYNSERSQLPSRISCFGLGCCTPFLIPLALVGGIKLPIGLLTGLIAYIPASRLAKAILRKDNDERQSIRPLHCADCQMPLKQLNSKSLIAHLSHPQQVAQNLGHIKFEGWRCPNCHPGQTSGPLQLRAYVITSDSDKLCPTCQELTISKSYQVVEAPTYVRKGKGLITCDCRSCSYQKQMEQIIPILSSSSDGGGGDSGGGGGGGDSGGGGGDGGGG